MKSSDSDPIGRFLGRHGLRGGAVHYEHGTKCLHASEPTVLANFVGFCKSPARAGGRRVFLRGHNDWHSTLIPSLFRQDFANPDTWTAYRELIDRLPDSVRGTRFTRENFGAVLQHYGFNTPWLDVVDDLHIAIWFALHDRTRAGSAHVYRRSTTSHGWVVLVAAGDDVCVQDFREDHSSRNSRCNAQQAYSIAMQYDDANEPHLEQDFKTSVIGIVRIPNVDRWHLAGFRASQEYFFPSAADDNTYRKLLNPDVDTLARRIEQAHEIDVGSLGRVAQYEATTKQPVDTPRS